MRDKEQRKANHREYKKARAFTRGFLKETEGAQQHCNTAEGTMDTRASQLCKDRNSQLTFTRSQLTKWDPGIHICCAVFSMSGWGPRLSLLCLHQHTYKIYKGGQDSSFPQHQLWPLGMGGTLKYSSLSYGFLVTFHYLPIIIWWVFIKQTKKNNQQETASPLLKFKCKKFGLELSQIYCF